MPIDWYEHRKTHPCNHTIDTNLSIHTNINRFVISTFKIISIIICGVLLERERYYEKHTILKR